MRATRQRVQARATTLFVAEEVDRWVSLYRPTRERPDGTPRWAILEDYARQRAAERLATCLGLPESFEGKTVLDLACGSGDYAGTVLRGGGRWIGLDLSPDMLRSARRSLGDRPTPCAFMIADAAHLPLRPASADLVYCVGLLSYFRRRDARRILESLPELVRPGGQLVVQTIRFDPLTWLRSRLPGWVPRPLRLPGPLYARRPSWLPRVWRDAPVRMSRQIKLRKFKFLPFQTIYLFEKR